MIVRYLNVPESDSDSDDGNPAASRAPGHVRMGNGTWGGASHAKGVVGGPVDTI